MNGRGRALLVTLWLVAATAGCGLKGALYLPEKSQEIVVRPGPAATATPPAGTGSAAEAPPAPQLPAEDPATEPEVPEDAESAPPPPPGTPTAAPPGTGRG